MIRYWKIWWWHFWTDVTVPLWHWHWIVKIVIVLTIIPALFGSIIMSPVDYRSAEIRYREAKGNVLYD